MSTSVPPPSRGPWGNSDCACGIPALTVSQGVDNGQLLPGSRFCGMGRHTARRYRRKKGTARARTATSTLTCAVGAFGAGECDGGPVALRLLVSTVIAEQATKRRPTSSLRRGFRLGARVNPRSRFSQPLTEISAGRNRKHDRPSAIQVRPPATAQWSNPTGREVARATPRLRPPVGRGGRSMRWRRRR